MMIQEDDVVRTVACRMVQTYGDRASDHARLRARDLKILEPRAAARWKLVARAIEAIHGPA